MQAIETKYLSPTITRGPRVKARCVAESVTVPWDYSLNVEENHRAAAAALVLKLGWQDYGEWVTGYLGENYVHVLVRS